MTDTARKPDDNSAATVQRGKFIVLGIILALLTWYLLADRYTPSTTQARTQGYVVGVAPKVAGLVTEVWVGNNRRVEAGQEALPDRHRAVRDRTR